MQRENRILIISEFAEPAFTSEGPERTPLTSLNRGGQRAQMSRPRPDHHDGSPPAMPT